MPEHEQMLRDLSRLIEQELSGRSSVDVWRSAANQFMASHPDQAEVLPHIVQHYLADIDIRATDPAYRHDQVAEVRRALENLSSPAD